MDLKPSTIPYRSGAPSRRGPAREDAPHCLHLLFILNVLHLAVSHSPETALAKVKCQVSSGASLRAPSLPPHLRSHSLLQKPFSSLFPFCLSKPLLPTLQWGTPPKFCPLPSSLLPSHFPGDCIHSQGVHCHLRIVTSSPNKSTEFGPIFLTV